MRKWNEFEWAGNIATAIPMKMTANIASLIKQMNQHNRESSIKCGNQCKYKWEHKQNGILNYLCEMKFLLILIMKIRTRKKLYRTPSEAHYLKYENMR